jgi:hypothetical protein
MHPFQNPPWQVQDSEQWWGDRKVKKVRKGTFIKGNYQSIHSGHGNCVFWEKLHPLSKQKPKSNSQPIHSTLLLQNSVTYGTFTLVSDMISAPRPKSKIEAMCEHQLASESV